MLRYIDHIQIVVSDVEETKDFFLTLGFILDNEIVLEGEWVADLTGIEGLHALMAQMSLAGSKTHLHLVEFVSPRSQENPNVHQTNLIGFRHIAFEVEQIEEYVETLKQKGIEPLSPVQEYAPWKKKMVYFWGPDQILLEVLESLSESQEAEK